MDVELIKCIPISSSNRPNQWCWFYDNSGNYLVKSGYKLARALFVDCGQSRVRVDFGWWKSLWKGKVVAKVKICLWGVFHAALPTRTNLLKRKIPCNDICP